MMLKLDPEKLKKLHKTEDLLEKRYGKRGIPEREAFHERALANYYAEILRDRRKELKITQQQLADKIGKERSYIAHVERGETDMQMSNFFKISNALGIGINFTYA
jgi:ribosome-binding protein aMBF1 (putative translation factor)